MAGLWRLAEEACFVLSHTLTEERIQVARAALRRAVHRSPPLTQAVKQRLRQLDLLVLHAHVELLKRRARQAEAIRRPVRAAGEDPGMRRSKPKHKIVREERIAAGLCTSCGRARDLSGVTCSKCLRTDKAWRRERAQREKTAVYLDDECQPMVLRFTPRMLPVLGERKDCANERECLDELIRACGKHDAPGSSCPTVCPHFQPLSGREELLHLASSRDGDVWDLSS